jgi:ABC-2 type transport system permease protein
VVRHLRETVGIDHLRRQLALPASWLAVGVFALLAGLAFNISLNSFVDRSAEALTVPPPVPVNVNQQLIRPFLLEVGLIALLVLPCVTAVAYPHRAGKAGVIAPFAASCGVYALMLATTACLVGVLFVYGSPEWAPVVSGYLGLALMGAAFISVALFISSLAGSALSAGMAAFAVSLLLAAAAWLARSGTPAARTVFQHLSLGESLDDFAKGVIDTGAVISCLTVMALGLFLTARTLALQRDDAADR